MHTARQLKLQQFSVSVRGAVIAPTSLFHWEPLDRLGIVVDTPLGALGASLAIQLGVACFFSLDHRERRDRLLYAEIYLFHVGGRWGDYSAFDFWPQRREIFLQARPHEILAAINDRAITQLLVPDGPFRCAQMRFKEPDAARDRIKQCFAYAPDGRVDAADVSIATRHSAALENLGAALNMRSLLEFAPDSELRALPDFLEDYARWQTAVTTRLEELTPASRMAAERRVRHALAEGQLTEGYRRCSVDWALGRLCGNLPDINTEVPTG